MSDKIKKLSTAIRLGATFRPQCIGKHFKDGGSCAKGAAYEAITGVQLHDTMTVELFLMERFRISDFIRMEIGLMNDIGHTREQIADWLEARGL